MKWVTWAGRVGSIELLDGPKWSGYESWKKSLHWCLCESQHDPKDQEGKEHALCRVGDDAHQGPAEAQGRKCEKKDTANNRPPDAPGHHRPLCTERVLCLLDP